MNVGLHESFWTKKLAKLMITDGCTVIGINPGPLMIH